MMDRCLRAAVLVILCAGSVSSLWAAKPRLNDAGLNVCVVNDVQTTDCEGTWQDAEFGRDATKNNSEDGFSGFSFTKIDSTGQILPADAISWSCVRDNVTGLMWENKTQDDGIHDADNTYVNDGKTAGPSVKDLQAATNQERLCGYDDWRLPNRRELFSIASYMGGPNAEIDENYFPHTQGAYHWTSSHYRLDNIRTLWALDFSSLALEGKFWAGYNKLHARLVRGAVYGHTSFLATGDEVTDNWTGLVWRRCSEGQTWNGQNCTGEAILLTWAEGIERSRKVSQETGTIWRVPNMKELESIVDYNKATQPAINEGAFPRTPRRGALTSTTFNSSPILVDFKDGRTITATGTNSLGPLRLVRSPTQ